jgi:hypothetical protein
LEVFAVMFVGLENTKISVNTTKGNRGKFLGGRMGRTYKGQSTVSAPANLRLVDVDENPRVAEGSAAAVARDDALVGPGHGLLVDEVDGGERAGLE